MEWILILFFVVVVGVGARQYMKVENERRALAAALRSADKTNKFLKNMIYSIKDRALRREEEMREAYQVKLEAEIKMSRDKQRSAIKGQMAETIAPFFKEFKWNPKDAKFLGSPIDFVVFDGMSESDVKKVVFVEVKIGSGSLSKNQRVIRDKILNGEVDFEVLKIKDRGVM